MSIPVPSADDFSQWQDNAVTRFVMAGLEVLAADAVARWKDEAWTKPTEYGPDFMVSVSHVNRARVASRVEAYRDLANLSYEDALGANGAERPE